MSQRIEMYNKNTLKIGLFGANCSSARTATLVPERWQATWPDCLKMARIADERGIDFLLPIGRWKGYGGDSDFHGDSLQFYHATIEPSSLNPFENINALEQIVYPHSA